jgi:aerobic-type carbon monoxide dehydrogenase small subunit (CoxS/CutS family)
MALTINSAVRRGASMSTATPLLWVSRDVLGMTGTKFGSHYHFAETNWANQPAVGVAR